MFLSYEQEDKKAEAKKKLPFGSLKNCFSNFGHRAIHNPGQPG